MQDTAGKLRAGLLMTCLKSWWPADGAGTERASQLSQEKGGGYQGLSKSVLHAEPAACRVQGHLSNCRKSCSSFCTQDA